MKTKTYVLCLIIALFYTNVWANPPKKNKAEKHSTIKLNFSNVVGQHPLKLNDSMALYANANGDLFKVTTFKYYISNISLVNTDGLSVNLPESYLLINAADSASLTQQLPAVAEGKYQSIRFTIGVDSARNFAGAQTGALDPAKGMFWSWNSGYIFVKMEGESPQSTAKKNRLTFHIGGVKTPNNTLRTFGQNFSQPLKVKAGRISEISIVADVAALFAGQVPVNFSKLNFTMGGPNSVVVADNYQYGLFKITQIKN